MTCFGTVLYVTLRHDGRGNTDGERQGRLGLVGTPERAIVIGARLDVFRLTKGGTEVCVDWQRLQP